MKNLRERKKSETRRRLAVAAVELLAEEGEEAVTIAAIARRADVSTRTFHNYFQNREEAFFHFIEVVTTQWKDKLDELPASDGPIRNIRDILLDMIEPRDGYIMSPANFIQLGDNVTVFLGSHERVCARGLMHEFEEVMYDRTDGTLSRLEVRVLLPAMLAAAGVALETSREEGGDPVDYVNRAFEFFETRFSAT